MIVFDGGRVQQTGSPEDIFYHPKSRYLAELVGFSNLFDDAVIEGHGREPNVLSSGLWEPG